MRLDASLADGGAGLERDNHRGGGSSSTCYRLESGSVVELERHRGAGVEADGGDLLDCLLVRGW